MIYIVTGKPSEGGHLREITLSEYLGLPEWVLDALAELPAGGSEAKPSNIRGHGTGLGKGQSLLPVAKVADSPLPTGVGTVVVPFRPFICRGRRS